MQMYTKNLSRILRHRIHHSIFEAIQAQVMTGAGGPSPSVKKSWSGLKPFIAGIFSSLTTKKIYRNYRTLSTPGLQEPCVQGFDLKSAWATLGRDLPRLRNGGRNKKQAYPVRGNWTASELETRGPCSDSRRAECSLRLAGAGCAPYTLHTLRASCAKYKMLIACVCSRDPYPKEGLYSFVARTRVSLSLRLSLATCLSFLP